MAPNHGAAALVLIASLLVAVVALSGADARLTVVRRDANGGTYKSSYILRPSSERNHPAA